MKTNKIVTLIAMLMLCVSGALADGVKSLRLSEVAIGDSTNGGAWIEIQNTSWGTQNLGGFYITNDPSALDPNLSAPERISKMRLIPTGNPITKITPQNCLVFYADGHENLGIQHLKFTLHPGDIVAIYSGNGVKLIDSVKIPTDIKASQSYARDSINTDGEKWVICNTPTPTRDNNYTKKLSNSKINEFKENDPHGFAMSILAMGVVFGCLILLYLFFRIFGKVANIVNAKTATSTIEPIPVLPASLTKDTIGGEEEVAAIMAVTEATAGTGDENLDVALIALTIQAELAHDEESGVITIKPTHSEWANKASVIEAGMLK